MYRVIHYPCPISWCYNFYELIGQRTWVTLCVLYFQKLLSDCGIAWIAGSERQEAIRTLGLCPNLIHIPTAEAELQNSSGFSSVQGNSQSLSYTVEAEFIMNFTLIIRRHAQLEKNKCFWFYRQITRKKLNLCLRLALRFANDRVIEKYKLLQDISCK